jgi:ubiquinone/menaquinone biosynthesis C-methylase UbiE
MKYRATATAAQLDVVTESTPGSLQSINELTPILFGAAAFQQLNAACELGLFDLLHQRPNLCKEEIAAELRLQPRAIDILLLGTTALRLTEKVGPHYFNSKVIDDLVSNGMWQIFKDTVAFEQYICYAGQVDFTESLRDNTNVGLRRVPGSGRDLYRRLAENPQLQKVFYRYMHSWSKLANPLLFRNLDLSNARRVLDVGGGDAVNAIGLVKAFPHVDVTVLELPGGAAIARRKVMEAGFSDRITIVEHDMFQGRFPEGFDCVLFSHLLVIWVPEENIALLKNAYHALNPGGRVAVFSSISNDEGSGPLMAALDSVYFAAIPAEGGMIYAWHQYEEWMRAAGFKRIEYVECGTWTPHGLICGYRD